MTSSDFNMLRLEAPRDILQITDGSATEEETLEVANPAVWLRALARQQKQAEQDLEQLLALCGNTVDKTDQRLVRIESAYQGLAEGTRYVYDRLNANKKIAEEWIRSELSAAANAYQSFARNVWQAIMERTQESEERQICQATQLARINDALAFLGETNTARSQHLANFQGNIELWAAAHQNRVAALETQLREARAEIQQVATRIPLPTTPARQPSPMPGWRSPLAPTNTSAPSKPPTPPELDSPLRLPSGVPTRRARPTTPEMRERLQQLRRPPTVTGPPQELGTGGGETPPRPTRRAPAGPPPSPSPSSPSEPPSEHRRPPLRPHRETTPPKNPAPTITTQDLVRLVAQGVEEARRVSRENTRTARLKMTNPETFDGKPTTPFNHWWKSVTKYLSFYPDTGDQQKIAWVGTLLTGTAKAWDLHRYDTMGENDSWNQYATAIRAEYLDTREAANAQLKLSQLKYTGDIRAYLTEFRALNNYARATGEGLQEKIDLAMLDSVLDMRFSHYLEEFADDEGFLQATYQAALQVEKKKALKTAREAMRSQPLGAKDPKKEKGKEKERGGENTSRARQGQERNPAGKNKRAWVSLETALQGVPQKEVEEYKATDSCWRCGRPGHKTFESYAFTTAHGTRLPAAPGKTAAATDQAPPAQNKRKATEEPEERQNKQQKVAAVEKQGADPPQRVEVTLWDDSDSDF